MKQDDAFRYVTPAELIIHGILDAVFVAKPKALAYRNLGNMIAPIHGISALLQMLKADRRIDSTISFQQFIQPFLDQLLKSRFLTTHADGLLALRALQQKVQTFMSFMKWMPGQPNQWPAVYFYRMEHGVVSLEGLPQPWQTLQVSNTMEFKIAFHIALVTWCQGNMGSMTLKPIFAGANCRCFG